MSESDDSVIEQLQSKRRRPRRESPARRVPTAAPARPTVIAAAPELAAQSADGGPSAKPEKQPVSQLPRSPDKASAVTRPLAAAKPSAGAPSLESAPGPPDASDGVVGAPLHLAADEPTANYAVRVRRTLDDLVAWRLAELRRRGTRTSKVELTEMLLWELADAAPEDIVARLGRFRSHAPR
jgi:hypothetical protein